MNPVNERFHSSQIATQTLGLVLVHDFSMIAFTSLIEPLRLANRAAGQQLYDWKIYSIDGRPITASNGIRLEANGSIGDIGPMPNVVVCGGIDIQRQDHSALIAKLRRLAFYGVSIGAVCTGSYVLAKAGLLEGYRCTIHWENHQSFREEFPNLDVTDELFEIDRNRFTCAGGTAAIDMMLSMISHRCGQDVAASVTDELIHHRMRSANERQRMELRARLGVANQRVLAVVAKMEQNIEEPLSCSELAVRVGFSARQLERLFQKYIGQTPTRYYLGLRLGRARHLLLQTSMPILSVALACGFVSASHFSKCYSEHFKRTPSEERFGPRQSGRRGGRIAVVMDSDRLKEVLNSPIMGALS
ncbi:MAG: GlxA family transcriptional regulator [Hyphomicrobiales bacterium]